MNPIPNKTKTQKMDKIIFNNDFLDFEIEAAFNSIFC